MPLGVAVVFAGLLVLVRTLRGEREHGEAGVIGSAGGGVLAKESDERNAVLIHGEVSCFEFPDWPGSPIGEARARSPAPKCRAVHSGEGPKLVLGEESGKQSGDVPQGAGYGPKRVTGRAGIETGRRMLHGRH